MDGNKAALVGVWKGRRVQGGGGKPDQANIRAWGAIGGGGRRDWGVRGSADFPRGPSVIGFVGLFFVTRKLDTSFEVVPY